MSFRWKSHVLRANRPPNTAPVNPKRYRNLPKKNTQLGWNVVAEFFFARTPIAWRKRYTKKLVGFNPKNGIYDPILVGVKNGKIFGNHHLVYTQKMGTQARKPPTSNQNRVPRCGSFCHLRLRNLNDSFLPVREAD